MIERARYLKQLENSMNNQTVKVVTGLRRSGKSYLLNEIFRQHLKQSGIDDAHIIAVALDMTEHIALRDPRKLQDYVLARVTDEGNYYVFIDEIQMSYRVKVSEIDEASVPEEDRASLYVTFYDVLNSLNARRNIDVYVTGSNSRMLSEDIATNFRGRRTEVRMFPLSFAEFYSAYSGDKLDAWADYLTYGGLPQVVAAAEAGDKQRMLSELYEKTYLADVIERHQISDRGLMENVIRVLASSVGSLTNPTRLVNTIKSQEKSAPSIPTFRRYLEYLTTAYLFRRAERYDVRGRRYLDYPSKYYMADVGMRNALLGYREQEETHLMENIIFNELVLRGYRVDVGVVEILHREEGHRELRQHEIDFVVNTGREKIYIQSAFGMNEPGQREREMLPLLKTGDSCRKIIVTNGNQKPWVDDAGIHHTGILPFLLDETSVDAVMGGVSRE